MMYFWITIAALITGAHIIIAVRVKRYRKNAAKTYTHLIDGLKQRTLKEMKKKHLNFDRSFPVVSDSEEAFLICLDSKKKKISFTDKHQIEIYDFTEITDSIVDIKYSSQRSKYISHVRMLISLTSREQPIQISFSDNPTKKSSGKGTFITANAQRLHQVIQEVINENQLETTV